MGDHVSKKHSVGFSQLLINQICLPDWLTVFYVRVCVCLHTTCACWIINAPNGSFLLWRNLEGQAVSEYYSVAQTETLIWAVLPLQRHFIHLTEEHVNTVCNSPFKGHQPAFVEYFEEPLFPSLEQPALAISQTMESGKKKGQEEGKLFPGALQCCNADTVSCGKTWRRFSSVVVYAGSLLFTFAFRAPSPSTLPCLMLENPSMIKA